MGWREFFELKTWKVVITIILLVIQFMVLAGCFEGGGWFCYINPTTGIFVLINKIIGGFSLIFPIILILSILLTYLLVCIIWKIFEKNSEKQVQESGVEISSQNKRWLKAFLITVVFLGIMCLFFYIQSPNYVCEEGMVCGDFMSTIMGSMLFYSIPLVIIIYFIIGWLDKRKQVNIIRRKI